MSKFTPAEASVVGCLVMLCVAVSAIVPVAILVGVVCFCVWLFK